MLNHSVAQLVANACNVLEACGLYPCDVGNYDELVNLIVDRTVLVEMLATFPLGSQGYDLCCKEIVKVECKLAPFGLV